MTQLCKCYDNKVDNNNKHANRNKKTNTLKMQWFILVGKNHICNYSPPYLEKTEPLKYGSKRRPKEKYAW